MIQESQIQTKPQKKLQKTYEYFFKAALLKGPQFYMYEAQKIPVNKKGQQNYEIVTKIGRGKYSDVFRAMNVKNDQSVVLKILKPIRQDKIKRQIKILTQLNHPNIVKLHEVLRVEPSKCYVLVLEYVNTADYRDDLIDVVDQKDIRKIIYQILQGLLHCHEKGIFHRDIKPQNLLIEQGTYNTKISDWGLAEYYLPDTEYNVRVASRHFKGPELLLNNRNYDFSLDIWSLGLVFAGFLFRKHVMFRGNNNPDQLNEIMKHFGSEEIQAYIKKYRLEPDQQTQEFITRCTQRERRPWSYYLDKDNKNFKDETALDLMDKMLQIDHTKRINVIEALKHKYFENIQHEN